MEKQKMNWKRIIIGSTICLSALGGHGSAQERFKLDSIRLLAYCKLAGANTKTLSEDDLNNATICTFYLNGVLDGYRAGVEPTKSLICTPDNFTHGQLVLVVTKYLEDHPESLHNEPYFLILDALSEAFPCKSKQQHK